MSAIDQALAANQTFVINYDPRQLSPRPRLKLAVLTCMDTRISYKSLGLEPGDAHMIRNAGGVATDDAIRSLILSTHLLGTRSIAVIQHTQCGLMSITDEEFRSRLSAETGRDASHLRFHAFSDIDQNVAEQVRRIRENPFLPKQIQVRGYAYDVSTGALREASVS